MKKILNIFFYVIMAISVIVAIYFFLEMKNEGRVSYLLIWTYILFALAIGLTLVFAVFNAASNPQSLKKMALNIGFLVVVFGVSYILASSAQTPVTAALPDGPPSEMTMKFTDMGLKVTYFLFVLTVLVALLGPVISAIRNR